ncbi:hypothetical protein NDA14_002539 [Ustilago hordei]|nr:hypothetical protein NDA14_002539 [Ustilago hordei]
MSLQQANPYIVDGKGHLLGRLAATLAKELLSGQKVIVVRSELINVSGSFFRNKLKYHAYLHKRHLVNPKKAGPFHHRAPSRILYKAIRGMLPHKTARGAAALQRLKVYEGPGRKFATIKRISHEVGWNHMETVDKLEAKRKVKQQAYHERQVAASKKRAAAQTATADKQGRQRPACFLRLLSGCATPIEASPVSDVAKDRFPFHSRRQRWPL